MINLENSSLTLIKDKLNIFTKRLEDNSLIDQPFFRQDKDLNKTYQNLSEDYIKEYSTQTDYIQYAKTYFNRLVELKPLLIKQSSEKWSNTKICKNMIDMKGKVKY